MKEILVLLAVIAIWYVLQAPIFCQKWEYQQSCQAADKKIKAHLTKNNVT